MMPQPHNRPDPLTLAVLASLLEPTGGQASRRAWQSQHVTDRP